jgi:hypothetical protein
LSSPASTAQPAALLSGERNRFAPEGVRVGRPQVWRRTMKAVTLAAAALLVGTAAFAQDTTTTVKKEEGILGSKTTVETKKTEPSTSTSTDVTTTGTVGCSTETKQKTDALGDTTTTKKTVC